MWPPNWIAKRAIDQGSRFSRRARARTSASCSNPARPLAAAGFFCYGRSVRRSCAGGVPSASQFLAGTFSTLALQGAITFKKRRLCCIWKRPNGPRGNAIDEHSAQAVAGRGGFVVSSGESPRRMLYPDFEALLDAWYRPGILPMETVEAVFFADQQSALHGQRAVFLTIDLTWMATSTACGNMPLRGMREAAAA